MIKNFYKQKLINYIFEIHTVTIFVVVVICTNVKIVIVIIYVFWFLFDKNINAIESILSNRIKRKRKKELRLACNLKFLL